LRKYPPVESMYPCPEKYERCAGYDVHKETVVVHVVVPGRSEARTFGTTTGELLALADSPV
jgi:hypothetical protein